MYGLVHLYIYFLFFKFFSNVLGYIFVKLFSLTFARISAQKVCDQLYDIFAKPIPQVYLNNQPKKIRKLHSILLWYVFFSPITPIFINWWNQIITDNGKMCQIFAQQRPNQMKTSCQKNSHWLNDHSQIMFWSYCLKHHINDHNDNCDNDDDDDDDGDEHCSAVSGCNKLLLAAPISAIYPS